MLIMLYPKGDDDAGYLAFKVKAIASSQGLKVYIPPRMRRREELPKEVRYNLKRAKKAILLVADPDAEMDRYTWAEMMFLLEENVPVKAVVPLDWTGLSLLHEIERLGVEILRYEPYQPYSLWGLLNQEVKNSTEARLEGQVAGAVIAIGLLLLLMWSLSEVSKKK
ncbi:MAG: hypothetical protein ACP5QG_00025 [candidate division WOR-3 bacterium]